MDDYVVINPPAVIPIGESDLCFQLLAIDDEIVENEEEFILIIELSNPNDRVIENATIVISDNDCKDYIVRCTCGLH